MPAEQAASQQAPEAQAAEQAASQQPEAQAAAEPPPQLQWPSDAEGLAEWMRSHGLFADFGRVRYVSYLKYCIGGFTS